MNSEALRLAEWLDKLDVRAPEKIMNCISAASLLRTQASRITELEAEIADLQVTSMMAECMDMVRQDLIDADVIAASVPPMMVSDAVVAKVRTQQSTICTLEAEIQKLNEVMDSAKAALEKSLGAWGGTCAWHQDVRSAINSIEAYYDT
jgi:hypothetical protein